VSGLVERFGAHVVGSRFSVERGIPEPTEYRLVERKGAGHPDTLADHLAEELSGVYSRYTLAEFGAVLHHNFDKLALLGGAVEVRYGGGVVLRPVRVLVNGRASRWCGGVRVPVEEIVRETVRSFFSVRLPELAEHVLVEMNVSSTPSPGAVQGGAGRPERAVWFEPASTEDLRERRLLVANDTSFGTGWAPLADVESFVHRLVDCLSLPGGLAGCRKWCGSDVKVMAFGGSGRVEVVLCVPQKAAYVPCRSSYVSNCAEVLDFCERVAATALPGWPVSFRLNTRDIVDRDEIYLTVSGSSVESGDEGLVGRGNRVNGLITPLRPMNLEGANGKNPVYHVGKVYNVAARRAAERLHARFGGHVEVHLVSAAGQPLARPWQTLVRMTATSAGDREVEEVVWAVLDDLPAVTAEILAGRLHLA
jgi:S-adenosylmethionine synthetase